MTQINYTKTHQKFSDILKEPDALVNPEKYLGKNYSAVLEFWARLDDLSKEQWEEFSRLYCNDLKVASFEATCELIVEFKNPTYFTLFSKFFNTLK